MYRAKIENDSTGNRYRKVVNDTDEQFLFDGANVIAVLVKLNLDHQQSGLLVRFKFPLIIRYIDKAYVTAGHIRDSLLVLFVDLQDKFVSKWFKRTIAIFHCRFSILDSP